VLIRHLSEADHRHAPWIREIAKIALAGYGSGAAPPEVATPLGSGASKSVSALNRIASDPITSGSARNLAPARAAWNPVWCCQRLARHESESPEIPVFASGELQLDEASRGCGRRREWAGESRTDRMTLE
jgi:hypothetical protein